MKENNVISERIAVSDAAVILGISQNELRANMKRGVLKIGKVIPPKTGKGNYHFIVYKSLLDKVVHGESKPEGLSDTKSNYDQFLLELLGEIKEIKTLLRQQTGKR